MKNRRNSGLVVLAFVALTLTGCADRLYKGGLTRTWDCGAYMVSLNEDDSYKLTAVASGQTYTGTYAIAEEPGGGHTISWKGQPNAFTSENVFIQGPSNRQMAIGRNAMTTSTMCVARLADNHDR